MEQTYSNFKNCSKSEKLDAAFFFRDKLTLDSREWGKLDGALLMYDLENEYYGDSILENLINEIYRRLKNRIICQERY